MRRRIFLLALAAAIPASLPLGARAEEIWAQDGDRMDQTHATFQEAKQTLEAMGYTKIVQEQAYLRGPWLKLLATAPDGGVVRALFDNTGNLIHVRPISDGE